MELGMERHQQRIIPASAGQTFGLGCLGLEGADHPRECGANTVGEASVCGGFGSSPRVRGKQGRFRDTRITYWIIPASAGQTETRTSAGRSTTDHPRECGANAMLQNGAYTGNGSSPRVRGKPGHRGVRVGGGRIIPASAGQTTSSPRSPTTPTDHPRECGANGGNDASSEADFGSSPRVRGKPARRHPPPLPPRIIPASAGQTPRT